MPTAQTAITRVQCLLRYNSFGKRVTISQFTYLLFCRKKKIPRANWVFCQSDIFCQTLAFSAPFSNVTQNTCHKASLHWLALSPPSKAVTQDRAGTGYTQPVAFCGLSSDRQWMNEDSVYENNLILNKHTHINIQPRFKVVLPLMLITEKWQMCKNRTKWIHRCPMPVALVCLAVPLYWIWYFRRDGE